MSDLYDCGECPGVMGCRNKCMKMHPLHTPEPWSLDENGAHPWRIVCESNYPGIKPTVCEVAYRPNARRIVACVNACAGLDNDLLEAIGEGALSEVYERLRGQRDKLLEALIHIQQVACSGSPELGIATKALAEVGAAK